MSTFKERWGITSNFQIIMIFIVFSINGSFATYIAHPVTELIGLSRETTNPWIFWPIRIFLVFFIYQITLPIVGFCLGQSKFFVPFTKKMLSRFGMKRFFSEGK
ncbi:MAG: diacylglyceryl transferase [Flavobacteriaceae bacterium]|nr:MAG: diacylglyceryl transferase [Flavobacteriaceae bacterium]